MSNKNLQLATLGGGCFWCVEAIFQSLRGVEKVVSGYSGSDLKNPTYREVCSGKSGHAEVIQITFNANEISFDDLVRVFLTSHDPTTPNRQGADWGSQYRSIILYHSSEQQQAANAVITELGPHFDAPIVTEVEPMKEFYEADEGHQDYYKEDPNKPYCSIVISPKLKKLREMHADKLRVVNA